MPARRGGAAAAFLQALSTREGAFLLEKKGNKNQIAWLTGKQKE